MKPRIFVPVLTAAQRQQLQEGLRATEAFTVRRCQILLASADGTSPTALAYQLRCSARTVRNAVHAFAREGLACLKEKSSRPLTDLLHHRPRLLGKATSLWTLELVAEVCYGKGWTPRQLSGEAIRVALKRLGIRWRRAKHWITSPDPAYARKKKPATA